MTINRAHQTHLNSAHNLNRRTFLAAAIAVPSLAAILAACGSDKKASGSGIQHADSKDDVVVRIGYEGGFTPPSYQFIRIPTLLITGDGRVISQGAQIEIYPGPLLPTLQERSINEAGIQKVLAFADASKLLQPVPSYEAPMNIADAPDTVVTITVNAQTYEHRAYALGIDTPETSPARVALAAFVEAMGDITKIAGAENLGTDKVLVADSYRIQARSMTVEDLAGYEAPEQPSPQIVAWPSGTGVTLASATKCAEVSASKVDAVLKAATQLTFFSEDGTTYQVAAVAKLAGDMCGAA